MDTAAQFRESRLEILRFLASHREQRGFAERVQYDDYASEFYCWWFDDHDPSSELTMSAFSPREIEILAGFSSDYAAADKRLGDRPRSIDALLQEPEWGVITVSAQKALEALGAPAT